MVTITDAQNQANTLQGLINSLGSAPDKNAIRPQIQTVWQRKDN
jgi:hypothetical protein